MFIVSVNGTVYLVYLKQFKIDLHKNLAVFYTLITFITQKKEKHDYKLNHKMAYPLIGIKRHELKIGRANYLATCPLKYSPAVFISQVAF